MPELQRTEAENAKQRNTCRRLVLLATSNIAQIGKHTSFALHIHPDFPRHT